MFVILYRWRIKPGKEPQFVAAWSEITDVYPENFDSLGSRLHRGDDGLFYAYAQWKSAARRESAFAGNLPLPAAEKIKEAIAESLPEVRLEVITDLLISPKDD